MKKAIGDFGIWTIIDNKWIVTVSSQEWGHTAFQNFCYQHFKAQAWHFPGGPVVETSPSNAGGAGSIPGRGAKFPHASGPKNQNIKQKQYCNKFNKDFKNGPHKKKSLKNK